MDATGNNPAVRGRPCCRAHASNQNNDSGGCKHETQAAEDKVYEVAAWTGKDKHFVLANVPRQVSLAGGAGGSKASGAKALGLLFC